MSTIKDVAERAGVSTASVSRVLNGDRYITEEMRKRVLKAMHELQYRPNRVAQRLRASKSRLVGVIISDIQNSFNTLALSSIEHVLSKEGFSVLVCNANVDENRESDFISLMQAEDVAGLILAPVEEKSDALMNAVQNGLPVVVIDRRMNSPLTDTVLANNQRGARAAIEHLINLGHQHIAIINGPQHLTSGRERYAGYIEAMTAAHLPVDPAFVRFGDYWLESGYQQTRELVCLPKRPSALFVANNMMTIGALNAIYESGLRIPNDIAVIGFDDVPWAMSINPPLTTVGQSAREIGVHAAELLLNRFDFPNRPVRTVVLDTELIVRASCGSTIVAAP